MKSIFNKPALASGLSAVVLASAVPLVGLVPARTAQAATDACGIVISKTDGTPWKCTFVDNFNSLLGLPVGVNGGKWTMQDTDRFGFWSGHTCYKPVRKNIEVSAGTLKLRARKESAPFACKPYGSPQFTTQYAGGGISTAGKFSQTYGRFEIRARYPTARVSGVHGGYWLYPNKHTYGKWPNSGENDVAEWWSAAPNLMLATLHYYKMDNSWPPKDTSWLNCQVVDASQWHTYAVEWTSTIMKYSIDGVQCWSRVWEPRLPFIAPQPFDHPFNVVLNLGVETQDKIDPSVAFPQTLEVDYVKVWK